VAAAVAAAVVVATAAVAVATAVVAAGTNPTDSHGVSEK
jgi:hypothetical protein